MIQANDSVNGDWAKTVKSDLNLIGLSMTFNDIKSHSTNQFKSLVGEKIREYTFKWLIAEKNKLKSVKHIKYDRFEMQNYLLSDKINTTEKMLLFQMRTKTLPLYAYRKFDHPDGNLNCPFCDKEEDTLYHQVTCSVINKGLNWITRGTINIENIYSNNLQLQTDTLLAFQTIYKRRVHLLSYFKTT